MTAAIVAVPTASGAVVVEPVPVALAEPPLPVMKQEAPVALVPAGRPENAAKAVPSFAKAVAKIAASAPAIEQPQRNREAVAAAKPSEPALDVAGLTARLRDTSGIGVFTKLALKNQVDDLLKQFRTHYQSGQKTSVANLRQPYDMLVLKVLALVQDSDPSLARTISGSREAIWGILADPDKFHSAT